MFNPSIKIQVKEHTHNGDDWKLTSERESLCVGAHCPPTGCNSCIGNIVWGEGELSNLTWETLEKTITIKYILDDIVMGEVLDYEN